MEKKIYFASDFHLGIPDRITGLDREKKLIRWLDSIKFDAQAIYLLGDIFDFWYEYRTVVPKGYTRFLSKLAEIVDSGIEIHFFRGNHDFWAFDYLNQECGVHIHDGTKEVVLKEKNFFLGHGDGLGDGDKGYKFLKMIFLSKINQFLFRWLHPDLGTKMGLYFSRHSRISKTIQQNANENYRKNDLKILFDFATKTAISIPKVDYFVFGHRHEPAIEKISQNAYCIVLGDWVRHFSYGVFDGHSFELLQFE